MEGIVNQIVKIRLFARLRDAFGKDTIEISVVQCRTVKDLRGQIALLEPEIASLLSRSQVAVNGELAKDDVIVDPRDEIAILPPVSGGG